MIRTDLRLVGSFAGYANRTFWRNPAAAFFTLFLPVFFLVLFSALFGNEPLGINGHQVSSATFTMVGIITFSVVSACYTNLAISVTTARETGFLKRVRGTPIPPWTFLSGRICSRCSYRCCWSCVRRLRCHLLSREGAHLDTSRAHHHADNGRGCLCCARARR